MELSVTCKCGSSNLSVPDDATDDSFVTCNNCGNSSTRWGDLKAAALAEAAKHIKDSLGLE